MDGARFDALTKTLRTTRSRRHLTRLLGGLSLGGVLSAVGSNQVAAALRIGGSSCTKGSQCKTGKCLSTNKCSCTQNYPRCKPPSDPCKKATCDFATKRCVTSDKEDGDSCKWGGMVCVSGNCQCPDWGNVCQQCTRCGPEGSCLPDPDRQGKACQETNGVCCQTVCCTKACNQAGQCPGFG